MATRNLTAAATAFLLSTGLAQAAVIRLEVDPTTGAASVFLSGAADNGLFDTIDFQAWSGASFTGVDAGFDGTRLRDPGESHSFVNPLLDLPAASGGLGYALLGKTVAAERAAFTTGPLGGVVDTSSLSNGELFLANLTGGALGGTVSLYRAGALVQTLNFGDETFIPDPIVPQPVGSTGGTTVFDNPAGGVTHRPNPLAGGDGGAVEPPPAVEPIAPIDVIVNTPPTEVEPIRLPPPGALNPDNTQVEWFHGGGLSAGGLAGAPIFVELVNQVTTLDWTSLSRFRSDICVCDDIPLTTAVRLAPISVAAQGEMTLTYDASNVLSRTAIAADVAMRASGVALSVPITPVPEPPTAALLMLGLVAAAGTARCAAAHCPQTRTGGAGGTKPSL